MSFLTEYNPNPRWYFWFQHVIAIISTLTFITGLLCIYRVKGTGMLKTYRMLLTLNLTMLELWYKVINWFSVAMSVCFSRPWERLLLLLIRFVEELRSAFWENLVLQPGYRSRFNWLWVQVLLFLVYKDSFSRRDEHGVPLLLPSSCCTSSSAVAKLFNNFLCGVFQWNLSASL